MTADDIVVGLDDTPTSQAAVSWALHTARGTDRRVVLVRVIDPHAFGLWLTPSVLREGLADFHRPSLELAVERARAGNAAEVRGLIRVANPNRVMTDLAHVADQIVLGIHPRSLTSRLLIGSMAHHLIRTAPCPVVLVPLAEATPGGTPGATRRVVVAVGGATGTTAVAYGFSTAARRRLPLTLLHAAHDVDAVSPQLAEQTKALRATIDSERRAHPDLVVDEPSVAGDLDTVLIDHVAPDDLLVVGHRFPSRAAPPIIERLLLPLLERPQQTVAVVADRRPSPADDQPSAPLTTADDLVADLGYHR